MEVQQQNQQPLEIASKQNLINAMEVGDKRAINVCLQSYKTPSGSANYPALFSIPTVQRLPALYESEPAKIAAIVTTGLTLSIESMNLSRPMNASQIVDLADTILDSSKEDNLSLEDVMLFLQKLIRGEYGKLYESMDIPKFMEFFEIYREERYQAIKQLREENFVQFKATPINDRIIDWNGGSEKDKQREALKDYLINKK